jgi:predicted RNase H-like HicB family nuclease
LIMPKKDKSGPAYQHAMAQRHFADIVIMQEKLSDGKPVFVAHCTTLGIASQGKNIEEASSNIREAIDLYLDECPEKVDDIPTVAPTFSFVEVRHAKASRIIRN